MAVKDERQKQPTKLETSHLSETCPSVPNEIIVEILLKLPVGSLLRFKSVCKLWHSLISNPYFIKSHLSLATSNPHYIHHRLISSADFSSCRLYDVMFDKPINVVEIHPFKHPHEFVGIIGSCNGLLCLKTRHNNNLFIWNPGTGRSSKVPNYGFKTRYGNSYVMFGFGYVESTDDYKVVVILGAKLVKIYSLKFGNWKKCDDFPEGICPMDYFGTYLNGALHWVGKKYSGSLRIVSFDLENETFGEVLQPEYDEGCKTLELGVLGESLCVLCNYPKDRADVWVMKVYGLKDTWTKLVSIPYLTYHSIRQYSVPLCISSDGKILLKLGNKLFQYDSKKNSVSRIPKLDDAGSFTHTFVESLVSPDPFSMMTM